MLPTTVLSNVACSSNSLLLLLWINCCGFVQKFRPTSLRKINYKIVRSIFFQRQQHCWRRRWAASCERCAAKLLCGRQWWCGLLLHVASGERRWKQSLQKFTLTLHISFSGFATVFHAPATPAPAPLPSPSPSHAHNAFLVSDFRVNLHFLPFPFCHIEFSINFFCIFSVLHIWKYFLRRLVVCCSAFAKLPTYFPSISCTLTYTYIHRYKAFLLCNWFLKHENWIFDW